MATKKELKKLTEADVKSKGVQAMSNTPARRSAYGASQLTPEQIKSRMDMLPSYVGELLNAVIDALQSGEFGDYVPVTIGEREVLLSELIGMLSSGEFASLMNVRVDGVSESVTRVIASLIKSMADVEEQVENVVTDGNLAVVKGEPVGSAVVAMADSTVIGDYTSAGGYNTTAGSRAFRVVEFNSEAGTYTLDSTEGISVGDRYSIYFRLRRSQYGRITDITGNTITVDRHFVPSGTIHENQNFLKSAYIYIVGKPKLGTIEIGRAAISTGQGTIAAESYSDAGGFENISDGSHSFTRGRYNIAGYAAASFGILNAALGLKSFIGGGENNYIDPETDRSAAFNEGNKVYADNGFVAGVGNVVTNPCQSKFGKYTTSTTNAIFAVGNGESESKRNNAFCVFPDGHSEVKNVGTSNLSIINKGYLENELENRLAEKLASELSKLVDGAPEKLDTLREIAEWIENDETGTNILIQQIETLEEAIKSAKETLENQNDQIHERVDRIYNSNPSYTVYAEVGTQKADGSVDSKTELMMTSMQGTGGALARYRSDGHLRDKNNLKWTFDNCDDADLVNKRIVKDYVDSKIIPASVDVAEVVAEVTALKNEVSILKGTGTLGLAYRYNNAYDGWCCTGVLTVEKGVDYSKITIAKKQKGRPVVEVCEPGFSPIRDILRSVVVQNGIKCIGYAAFSNCRCLSEIVLPKSIETIEENAFVNCYDIQNIYYTGTPEEWEKISIDEIGNDWFRSAIIHYVKEDLYEYEI